MPLKTDGPTAQIFRRFQCPGANDSEPITGREPGTRGVIRYVVDIILVAGERLDDLPRTGVPESKQPIEAAARDLGAIWGVPETPKMSRGLEPADRLAGLEIPYDSDTVPVSGNTLLSVR